MTREKKQGRLSRSDLHFDTNLSPVFSMSENPLRAGFQNGTRKG